MLVKKLINSHLCKVLDSTNTDYLYILDWTQEEYTKELPNGSPNYQSVAAESYDTVECCGDVASTYDIDGRNIYFRDRKVFHFDSDLDNFNIIKMKDRYIVGSWEESIELSLNGEILKRNYHHQEHKLNLQTLNDTLKDIDYESASEMSIWKIHMPVIIAKVKPIIQNILNQVEDCSTWYFLDNYLQSQVNKELKETTYNLAVSCGVVNILLSVRTLIDGYFHVNEDRYYDSLLDKMKDCMRFRIDVCAVPDMKMYNTVKDKLVFDTEYIPIFDKDVDLPRWRLSNG